MSADTKLFHSDTIYVRRATRIGLSYVPRIEDETFDSLVDKILFDWLKVNYPEIVDHLEQASTIDKEFREKLIRKANEQTTKISGDKTAS